jgi:protein-S-isoprenylcysteine O-methyltransferase Ste14
MGTRGESRGGGWVVLQFVALGASLVAGLGPPWPDGFAIIRAASGVALVVAGVALAIAAVRDLGSSLSPFPAPAEGAALRSAGVYARARHPIYGGLLLIAVGWMLASSPLVAIPALGLVGVLEGKSRKEERWLAERYSDYPAYRFRVRRRFVPFIW